MKITTLNCQLEGKKDLLLQIITQIFLVIYSFIPIKFGKNS